MPQLFSPTHVRCCQKAQAYANDALLHISGLDQVAQVYPMIAERVQELKDRQRLLSEAASAAMAAHRKLSTPD